MPGALPPRSSGLRPVWRLLAEGAQDGVWNMAVDRALLAGRDAGTSPPTLRLYRWEGPTVTVGRFQPLDSVDLAACERFGVAVARRPTGGRGVLHDDELTYSVIAGLADGLPRGVAASYRHLCAPLALAYRALGVEAELTRRARGDRSSAACYLHATAADLSVGAAKLSGSAQVWSHDVCLQHGCFVRSRDVGMEAAVFRLDEAAAQELARGTQTLAGALGTAPALRAIEEAVAGAFEEALGVRLEPDGLASAELRAARAAMADSEALGAS